MSKEWKQVYLCDRPRNTTCRKTGCVDRGGPCYCTLDPEKAKKDDSGKPIVVDCLRK